ncbi:MAG: type IIA DNA topoisomerase subunit B [Bacteroidales bacterium]|nr:type IIA DNA topoisomerase subunit B [Bacteroidales bacterium]
MSEIKSTYTEKDFQTLAWNEHIRLRPGMYIGKSGDGSTPDDGLYVLLKEVVDNSVDEYAMGHGKVIEVTINDKKVTVRDYGRGIPFGKVIEAANKMNTGAKYDNKTFQKAVGLNGVGLKAVNATSIDFHIASFRNGESQFGRFSKGHLQKEGKVTSQEKNGTLVSFTPDPELFPDYSIQLEFVEEMLKHYAYLNKGLTLTLNGKVFASKNGLLDLVNENMAEETLYPPIHLMGHDIEMVITHTNDTGESIMSFANGQNTSQGGTHLSVFREAVAKTIKDFLKRDFELSDIRQSIVGAISIRLIEPKFANQTKTILDSREIASGGPTVRSFIFDFVKEQLDNYLHKNPQTADILLKKITENEKERKAVSVVRRKSRETAKKISLHNKKLRDCRVHFTDKGPLAELSTLFITEGDSASGSITKSRDPNTQAVFSLRGKPENTYGQNKQVIYTNEEFNLLQAALNIEEDLDNLRYNKIVIATDADPDGMHIRMLLLSFFLQFFPELVRHGHIYILQTPLFRVRNKKETHYCYSETEKDQAVNKLGTHPEITRFKGLGEISPEEFKEFIGEDIRLDKVRLGKDDRLPELLRFYMGDNTPQRRDFIVNNLRMTGN